MKKVFFISVVLLVNTVFSQQSGWVKQSPELSGSITKSFMLNEKYGWCIVDNYYIYFSSNGGKNWNEIYKSSMSNVQSMCFSDESNGFLVGNNGMMLKTTDGGHSWLSSTISNRGSLLHISFLNKNHGWIVGDNGTVLESTNKGNDWIGQNIPTTEKLIYVHFVTDSIGWILGDSKIYKTIDGGKYWFEQSSGGIANLRVVKFLNKDIGWIMSSGGTLLLTTNGGNNWKIVNANISGVLNDMFFLNEMIGWVAGYTWDVWGNKLVSLYKTLDGGNNWRKQPLDYAGRLFNIFVGISNSGWIIGQDISFFTLDAGEYWHIYNYGTNNNLQSISFVDKDYGWASGGTTTIVKTTNGGNNWIKINVPASASVSEVSFINKNIGVLGLQSLGAGSYSCRIVNTIDGGLSWSESSLGGGANDLTSIFLVDSLSGWTTSQYYYRTTQISSFIHRSYDGFKTWPYQYGIPNVLLNTIFFVDKETGWAGGDGGQIFKTTDDGKKWIKISTNTSAEINEIFFVTRNIGWIVCDDGVIHKTTDGGNTWLTQTIPNYLGLNSIFFVDTNTGWAVGNYGRILFTSDGGERWEVQESGTKFALNKVVFVDETTGWIAGDYGIILKTTSGGLTSIQSENEIPSDLMLLQNYPNPFNPSTTIEYFVPQTAAITIKVYDLLGNEVITLVDQVKPVGRYETHFDGSKYSSGLYFYILQNGAKAVAKKMLIVK